MKCLFNYVLISALFLSCMVSCDSKDDIKPLDLSVDGTANCYIVSKDGEYFFPAVIGNSSKPVGDVGSVEVLWESLSTNVAPSVGELIRNVSFKDGKIVFKASGKNGNAVIAAKDKDGTILWSWHIWMTDTPKEQVYVNNSGIMMDRNLGAISAVPGSSGAYGLLYQWGRKDPFLCAGDDISIGLNGAQKRASSSITWPAAVTSDAVNGTMEFAIANPTTFILENEINNDWLFTGDWSVEKTRWQEEKTIYDPCPPGWKVPECGIDGIWGKALGTIEDWENPINWDESNYGVDFSKTDRLLGNEGPIWYPAAGLIYGDSGDLNGVSEIGGCWSVTNSISRYASVFGYSLYGYMMPCIDAQRAYGCSVRCQKIQ